MRDNQVNTVEDRYPSQDTLRLIDFLSADDSTVGLKVREACSKMAGDYIRLRIDHQTFMQTLTEVICTYFDIVKLPLPENIHWETVACFYVGKSIANDYSRGSMSVQELKDLAA